MKYDGKTETRANIYKNTNSTQISISGKDGEGTEVQVTLTDSSGVIYQSTQYITFGTESTLTFAR